MKNTRNSELTYWIECGAKKIMYLSIAIWNILSQGRVDSQALQVSSLNAFKTYLFISSEVSEELKYNYALVEMYGLDCLSICTTILQVSPNQEYKYITAKKQYHRYKYIYIW